MMLMPMGEVEAIEAAYAYVLEYTWDRAKQMPSGGWIIRDSADDYTDGLPGVYISPDGEPVMFSGLPNESWPQDLQDELDNLPDEDFDDGDAAGGARM